MIRTLSALAGVALLAACAPEAAAPSLAGSVWRPVTVGTLAVPDDIETVVRFGADGTATGNGGCNNFNGGYTESGDGLAFGPMMSSSMACPDPAMEVEGALFAAFAATASTRRDGSGLVLLDGAGTELAVLRPSEGD